MCSQLEIEARDSDDATINTIASMNTTGNMKLFWKANSKSFLRACCYSGIDSGCLSKKSSHETPNSRMSNRVPLKDSVSPQLGFSFDFRLDTRSSTPIYHKRNGTTCRAAQTRFTLTLHSTTTAFQKRPRQTSVES